ncbi:Zinc finger, C2H2 type [Geosmithia morbida]|uniref:Zinc finger, C2H2 type n=1 Tax=Geosmithia morbida TaxID=1094350 RepID=A0A9P5D5P8_9HYPO|nr:Zinc finger, C2H2 type [Geosmithia morbida]KAF4124010.1 Zinc finger, C2H2 type [Geosmithia morbida]
MARESTPPDSPLSSVASSEQYEEEGGDLHEGPAVRPSKRQKVEAGSTTSSAVVAEPEPEVVPDADPLDGMSDVSSDTSGDIPSSPANARLDEEDFQEQVTACEWDECPAGDLGNMDKLVEHIHNSHIESRQKKYTCEWKTCTRKGLPHASGYALKAHMRSHTREKPFYCYLPVQKLKRLFLFFSIDTECDRSFTRSDALAKHMRTVHETEALRPSDPIPKSQHSAPATGKQSKLKIIIKKQPGQQDDAAMTGTDDQQQQQQQHADGANGKANSDDPNAEYYTVLPKELFDQQELSYPVDKLYRKCYWESKWSKEIGDELERECAKWEEVYYKEWLEKEALLAQVIKSEVDWQDRRQAILSGIADVHISTSSHSGGGPEAKDKDDATASEAPEAAVTPAPADGDAAPRATAAINGHRSEEERKITINTIENGLRPTS